MSDQATTPAPSEKQLPVDTTRQTETARSEAYRQFEVLDEAQMIASERGQIIDQYFYSFKAGHEEIIGISWLGVKYITSKMPEQGHPISVPETIVEDTPDSYRGRAKGKDLATGEERWGFAEQPKVDEKGRRNIFAYAIAASKAQRNALRHFIPEVVIQEGYKEWKKKRGTGTTTQLESPVPSSQSPVHTKTVPSWKVPVTKDQATPEQIQSGVKQFPLLRDLKSFGMINTLGEETAIVPERPVPIDTALVDGFLMRRIVEPLVAKHQLAYTIQRTTGGLLEAVLIRGKLPDEQLKELIGGSRWAFERALEEKKP